MDLVTLMSRLTSLAPARAFIINLGAGKTEVIMSLRGPGASTFRTQQFKQNQNTISFTSKAYGKLSIKTVREYKHMGSILNAEGNCSREIAERNRKSKSSQAMARNFLKSRSAGRRPKVLYTRAVLQSQLFHHSYLWTNINKASMQALVSTYNVQLREACDMINNASKHISDIDFLKQYGFEDVSTHLRCARLRYGRRVVIHAPQQLKELLLIGLHVLSKSWMHQFYDDLEWLQTFAHLHMGNPRTEYLQWWSFIRSDHYIDAVKSATARFMSTLVYEKCQPSCSDFTCEYCPRRFHNLAAVRSHQYKVHNMKNKLRFYIEDGNCPVCLKMFHSRVRALHHIKERSKRCGEFLMCNFQPLEEDLVNMLDKRDAEEQMQLRKQGHHRRKSMKPVLQMSGPRLEGA